MRKIFLKPMRKKCFALMRVSISLKSMNFLQTTYRPCRGLNRLHRNSKIS